MLDVLLLLLTAAAVIFSVLTGNTESLSKAALNGCEKAVKLCLTLAGSMALWGGLMKTADSCGITKKITRIVSRPLSLIFRGLKGTDTLELIALNTAANLLGLGNAATPLGLKAMSELKRTDKASGRYTAFFVLLNTASIQLVPVTVASIRLSHGSSSPWEILLPTVITSSVALSAGLMTVCILYPKGEKNQWK